MKPKTADLKEIFYSNANDFGTKAWHLRQEGILEEIISKFASQKTEILDEVIEKLGKIKDITIPEKTNMRLIQKEQVIKLLIDLRNT